MARILLFGETGMLGHTVGKTLRNEGHDIFGTRRSKGGGSRNVGGLVFDALSGSVEELISDIGPVDAIINAIGVIKPYINEDDPESVSNAIQVNSLFPLELCHIANSLGVRVIQIATDCVFSGDRGKYLEDDDHDAIDVYGKTKSLGECQSGQFLNLRCSIIGPELGRSSSFLEWVLGQPKNAQLNGYTNHLWNGVTTQAFSKVVSGLIASDMTLKGVYHLVPADQVTKLDLVKYVAQQAGRTDISVVPTRASAGVNRTLETGFPEVNERLWNLAGYQSVPNINELVGEIFRD